MNPTLRYHILGKAYKKKISNDTQKMSGSGAAHKKDYDDVDMLDNVIENIEKMKFTDNKERKTIKTKTEPTIKPSKFVKGKMPLQFKFKV